MRARPSVLPSWWVLLSLFAVCPRPRAQPTWGCRGESPHAVHPPSHWCFTYGRHRCSLYPPLPGRVATSALRFHLFPCLHECLRTLACTRHLGVGWMNDFPTIHLGRSLMLHSIYDLAAQLPCHFPCQCQSQSLPQLRQPLRFGPSHEVRRGPAHHLV